MRRFRTAAALVVLIPALWSGRPCSAQTLEVLSTTQRLSARAKLIEALSASRTTRALRGDNLVQGVLRTGVTGNGEVHAMLTEYNRAKATGQVESFLSSYGLDPSFTRLLDGLSKNVVGAPVALLGAPTTAASRLCETTTDGTAAAALSENLMEAAKKFGPRKDPQAGRLRSLANSSVILETPGVLAASTMAPEIAAAAADPGFNTSLLGLGGYWVTTKAYARWLPMPMSGSETARWASLRAGLEDVSIASGSRRNQASIEGVELTDAVYKGRNMGAVAVALHEMGHVVQFRTMPAEMRAFLQSQWAGGFGVTGLPIAVLGINTGSLTLTVLGTALSGGYVVFTTLRALMELGATLRAAGMAKAMGLTNAQTATMLVPLALAWLSYVGIAGVAIGYEGYFLQQMLDRDEDDDAPPEVKERVAEVGKAIEGREGLTTVSVARKVQTLLPELHFTADGQTIEPEEVSATMLQYERETGPVVLKEWLTDLSNEQGTDIAKLDPSSMARLVAESRLEMLIGYMTYVRKERGGTVTEIERNGWRLALTPETVDYALQVRDALDAAP